MGVNSGHPVVVGGGVHRGGVGPRGAVHLLGRRAGPGVAGDPPVDPVGSQVGLGVGRPGEIHRPVTRLRPDPPGCSRCHGVLRDSGACPVVLAQCCSRYGAAVERHLVELAVEGVIATSGAQVERAGAGPDRLGNRPAGHHDTVAEKPRRAAVVGDRDVLVAATADHRRAGELGVGPIAPPQPRHHRRVGDAQHVLRVLADQGLAGGRGDRGDPALQGDRRGRVESGAVGHPGIAGGAVEAGSRVRVPRDRPRSSQGVAPGVGPGELAAGLARRGTGAVPQPPVPQKTTRRQDVAGIATRGRTRVGLHSRCWKRERHVRP